jgi:hypothetical protein
MFRPNNGLNKSTITNTDNGKWVNLYHKVITQLFEIVNTVSLRSSYLTQSIFQIKELLHLKSRKNKISCQQKIFRTWKTALIEFILWIIIISALKMCWNNHFSKLNVLLLYFCSHFFIPEFLFTKSTRCRFWRSKRS